MNLATPLGGLYSEGYSELMGCSSGGCAVPLITRHPHALQREAPFGALRH
jgi:hypothetical protein